MCMGKNFPISPRHGLIPVQYRTGWYYKIAWLGRAVPVRNGDEPTSRESRRL